MTSTRAGTARPPGRSAGSGRGRKPTSTGTKARNIILIIVVLLLAVVAGIAFTAYGKVQQFDANVGRTDPFAGLANRPGAGVSGAQNFLLIGSDTRDNSLPSQAKAEDIARTGGQRSDTLILMHVNAAHDHAYLVSIPRDLYVSVPAGGPWQGGKTKVNAAFAYGGARLAVQTIEGFSGVKIDHVIMINFAGFKKMTDALGGVNVVVKQTVTDPETHATFRAGVNHLNGTMALYYVRQRHGLPGGDFDRVKRQQQFIRALLATATARGTLTNPVKLSNFLDATAAALVVDKNLSVGKTAVQFRGLRAKDLTFITLPHLDQEDRIPGVGLVVRSDKPKALALFEAMNKDNVNDWLKANPANTVSSGY